MTEAALSKRKLVRVLWLDSHGGDWGWTALEDVVESSKPLTCESVGWVVREDKDSIHLTPNVCDGVGAAPPQFTGSMTIPKVCILSTKAIK